MLYSVLLCFIKIYLIYNIVFVLFCFLINFESPKHLVCVQIDANVPKMLI